MALRPGIDESALNEAVPST